MRGMRAITNTVEKPRLNASEKPKANPWNASCPSRSLIEMLASKWVLLLVPLLRQGPKRNGDLMRGIPGVSQKMLTQTLRDLERSGLVTRRDFGEIPPRVEYSLTRLGVSLAKAIEVFDNWVIRHYYDIAGATEGGR